LSPPKIIAEAGTAHNGDLSCARELIHAAKESGADYIKFQYIIADEILHPHTGMLTLFQKKIPLYEKFKQLERPPDFYKSLKEYCDKVQITFLCSAFGLNSSKALIHMGVDSIKIASPELNHFELLQYIAHVHIPVILSTGVSTLCDIEEALGLFDPTIPHTLLHCVTQYPADEASYNVQCIQTLRSIFHVHTGISDHTEDPILIPCIATVMGAYMIEKHFTLKKQLQGLDDTIAVDPAQLRNLCDQVRLYATYPYEEAFSALFQQFGQSRVKSAMGDGKKSITKEEKVIYTRTRRSLLAIRDMKKGEYLKHEDIRVLRAEQGHIPGLHPRYLPIIIGKKLCRSLKNGTGIQWDHVLENKDLLI